MLQPRTLKILAGLLLGYALLVAAAHWGPPLFEVPGTVAVMVPYLSIHLFHKFGVPGLLEHDGLCGWGWCAPTVSGWVLAAVLWIALAWLVAWGVARLTRRR